MISFQIEQEKCRRGSNGCKDQLMINKMILEICKKRRQNLSFAWIGYKKALGSVPHEWIQRCLELFKVSPRIVGFLKHNMKKLENTTLSVESGALMSDSINIKRGIFQVDFLFP